MGQLFPICIPIWSIAYAWQDLWVLCIQCSILSQTSSFLKLFSQQPTQWEASWKQLELSLTSRPLTDFPWLFCYTKIFFLYTNQHHFWTTLNSKGPGCESQTVLNIELVETYSVFHLHEGIASYSWIPLNLPLAVETHYYIIYIYAFIIAYLK